MCDRAAALGFSTPRFVACATPASFPLFGKPNRASGSRGATRIQDMADWRYSREKHPDFVYQEFIEGAEYTVDVLCDRKSNVIVASPRLRLATRSGQSIKGATVEEPELVRLCAVMCSAIGMIGPCNLQFIRRGREFFFIELNPRYAAGGLMLTVRAGANIPLLALRLMLGESVDPPRVRTGMMMLRYWDEIFLAGEEATPMRALSAADMES